MRQSFQSSVTALSLTSHYSPLECDSRTKKNSDILFCCTMLPMKCVGQKLAVMENISVEKCDKIYRGGVKSNTVRPFVLSTNEKKKISAFHSTVLESFFLAAQRGRKRYSKIFFMILPLIFSPPILARQGRALKRVDCVCKIEGQQTERLLSHLTIIIYHDQEFNYCFALLSLLSVLLSFD